MSKPVIVAKISPGRFNVIVGNHRVRARRSGMKTMSAYKVSSEVHLKFLTTEKGYLVYVEYWNSKLMELSTEVAVKAALLPDPVKDPSHLGRCALPKHAF